MVYDAQYVEIMEGELCPETTNCGGNVTFTAKMQLQAA